MKSGHVVILAGVLGLAVLLAAMIHRTDPRQPEGHHPQVEQFEADMGRIMAQNFLIGEQVKCLDAPLTPGQHDYLRHATAYVAQHYLLLIGTDAACQSRAIRSCETIFPGKCLAPPEVQTWERKRLAATTAPQ